MPTAQEIYQQLHAAKQSGQFQGGPVFPMMGVMPSIIAGVQGLFGDDPKRYVDGREVLAGQIPWGKPGRIPQERLDQWINERNKLYHATQPNLAQSILETGKINPSSYWASFEKDAPQQFKAAHKALNVKENLLDLEYNRIWKNMPKGPGDSPDPRLVQLSLEKRQILDQKNQIVQNWRESPEIKQLYKQNSGVSVSRVPKYSPTAYGGAPLTFELDPTKMPPSRPFTEFGWGKNTETFHYPTALGIPPEIKPNPRFEFENRTYNQSIPASAITKAMLDTSHLGLPSAADYKDTFGPLFKILKDNNIPIENYVNSQSMHSYRARIGEDVKRKLLEKTLGAGQ